MRATAHILEHEGIDALSTNRVAKRAGVSIGSLYQYFPNKESLVAALGEKHSQEVLAHLTKAFVGLGDATFEESVRILIRGNIDAHQKTAALHRIVSDEVGSPSYAKDSIEVHGAAMVRAVLDRHRDRLQVKDIALAAYVLSHAVESVVHAAVLGTRSPVPLDRVALELETMVIRYLVDPKTAEPAPARRPRPKAAGRRPEARKR